MRIEVQRLMKRADRDLENAVKNIFREIKWLDRPVHVMEECDIRIGVELLCYTPEEFARKRAELGIVRTATLEGADLLAAPPR